MTEKFNRLVSVLSGMAELHRDPNGRAPTWDEAGDANFWRGYSWAAKEALAAMAIGAPGERTESIAITQESGRGGGLTI